MLQIINLTKKYQTIAGDLVALDNLNLTLPDTGLVFITGKSGSGKTTLLNAIGALDDFDSGDIIIDGQSFSTFNRGDFSGYRNTIIGFVFQEYNLIPDYTVEKNIKIATELQGEDYDKFRINELLKLVDLEGLGKRKPNELSGGQKQRVAIARALIKNPKIIMADEPTGALDQATGIAIMHTLKKLSKEKLVVIVSHDLEIAETFADRIIRLVDGKLAEDTTIIDQVATSCVTVSGNTVYVKKGAKLNDEELSILGKAIAEEKKIAYVNDQTFRAKQSTESILLAQVKNQKTDPLSYKDDLKDLEYKAKQKDKKNKFVRSKMKTTSSMWLGLRSLKVKPVRLIFTIFFSVLAFTLFGMFDTLSQFDKMKSIALLLEENTYPTITASSTYSDKEANSSIRLGQQQIDEINKQTGYNFRGLYEIYDNNPLGMGGLNSIKEPKINFEVPVGKYYYQPYLNDFIEFSTSEIGNGQSTRSDNFESNLGTQGAVIDENGFNLTVLYGEYPDVPQQFPVTDSQGNPIYSNNEPVLEYKEKSFYDVAISKYTAESILYWLKANNVKYYRFKDEDNNWNVGSVRINEIKDLINVPITLSSNQRFFIRAIVDTGEIPEKYDSLKDIAPTSEVNTLAQDLSTYLSSSLNFKLFVRKGYVDTYRTVSNRATKYFASDNDYTLNGKGLIGGTSTHYSFYNTKDYFASYFNPERDNVVLFTSLDKLQKNDIIINVKDFEAFYEDEIESTQGITNAVKTLNNLSYLPKASYEQAVSILQANMNVNASNSKLIKESILTRQVKNSATVERFECRIVGVYFGIDKDITLPLDYTDKTSHAPYPVMMSSEFMTDLGIYNKQDKYSRMVSPSNTNTSDAYALSSLFCQESGVKIVWYGNSQLDNLENNQSSLNSITSALFYLSLVLAGFSAYMIFNYISISINSRKQSIGVLRALGSKNLDVITIFITEGIVISLISGVVACLTAYLGCIVINIYAKTVMGFVMKFAFYTIRQVLIILATTLITGLLACLIPIVKVCRKKPVNLIRKP